MSVLSREKMPNSYKEVYEILKYVRKEDRDAIPDDFIKMVESNMNKDYDYLYDYTKPIEEQTMLRETKAVLGYIYLNYWANDHERKVINDKLRNDIRISEEEKAKNYNYQNIFQSTQSKAVGTEEINQIEEKELVVVKENFIKRLINKLKNFFK